MTSRKKKAVVKSDDVLTFKKSEFLEKLGHFLEVNNACDGDWLNKVRVELLGEKEQMFTVRLQYNVAINLEMIDDGQHTLDEVANKIQNELEKGNLEILADIDESEFKVLDITPAEDYGLYELMNLKR